MSRAPTLEPLLRDLQAGRRHSLAIALDFDGVCKLFTDHKHQIMFTNLFLHLYEFQRVPFEVYRQAYRYINFRSPDYAGKERFLCVNALAAHLSDQGYRCALPGLSRAVAELQRQGQKINEKNLLPFREANDVARAIAWSREVNERVGRLTEIGLTPGIREQILTPFAAQADFYVVSTATEEPLRRSLEKEGVTFIRRYFGQETASKAEALSLLGQAGYAAVFMFGDSLEDARASRQAQTEFPAAAQLFFVPVIPGDEARCFQTGRQIIAAVQAGRADEARRLGGQLARDFEGREAGSQSAAPMTIRG